MFQPVTEIDVSAAAGCPVCGSQEVALDGVEQGPRVWLQLAECGHCEHRWTGAMRAFERPARGVVPVRAPQLHEGDARAA